LVGDHDGLWQDGEGHVCVAGFFGDFG